MSAKFVIRKDRKLRVFFGQWMDDVSLAVACRGPNYALTIVTDLPETLSADFTEVGFYLDFDQHVALLLDHAVCWDAERARLTGCVLGGAQRAAGFARLDLYPEEQILVPLLANTTTFEGLVEALQSVPLQDTWAGWQLHWGDGAALRAAVAGQLKRVPEVG